MGEAMDRARREDFSRFERIGTRWGDNDSYRHVNNVVYFAFFDTAVNRALIRAGVLDLETSPVVGLVVETGCRFFASIAFPDEVAIGIRVDHLGRSSVRYALALFRNDEDLASATGRFVHVYVDRATNRSAPIPDAVRVFLSSLRGPPEAASEPEA